MADVPEFQERRTGQEFEIDAKERSGALFFKPFKKRLTAGAEYITINRLSNGGIAQLVERLNGIQEASGSNPLISTKTKDTAQGVLCFGG